MSSEIRAGENRTFWIISNGVGYVDGVTDPNLVTTVGTGWHINWVGTDYDEYITACQNVDITPRNNRDNIATTSEPIFDRLSARQIRLWLIDRGFDLNQVVQAIYTIEDEKLRAKTLTEWEYAPYVEKSHPLLMQIASVLELSETDVDEAFKTGYSL
jgi:hypothetical protein